MHLLFIEAPTISKKVIKNLGETLCKIDPRDLSEEALTLRKKVKTIKKVSSSKAAKDHSEVNDEAKKKKKKQKNKE